MFTMTHDCSVIEIPKSFPIVLIRNLVMSRVGNYEPWSSNNSGFLMVCRDSIRSRS